MSPASPISYWNKPKPLIRRLGVALLLVNLLGTGLFAGLAYRFERQDTLDGIDATLCEAAEGIRKIVPPLIVDQTDADERTEPRFTNEYRKAHDFIERYIDATDLEFIYAIGVRADGSSYEISSNLTATQLGERADPMVEVLRKPYELSPIMAQSVATGDVMIDVAQDEYGYFRSCIVPITFASGKKVLFGADLEISAVNQRLLRSLLTNLGLGTIVLVATLIITLFFSNSIARDLEQVALEADAASRLAFLPGEAKMDSPTLEIDNVFASIYSMKAGLQAFGKFVPDAVVQRILTLGRAEVGGEKRLLSLMLTDVTDFTTICEKLDPNQVMVVMSEYFSHVVAPIMKLSGTLDKYVGDAIFAYWNAPNFQEDHAALCCRAALAARAASVTLAKAWEAESRWPWRTRFGLHAGETIVGNVGAPDRMDFTVIGSPVNLAARIEGLNKYYGTEILASQQMKQLVGDEFMFRSIDMTLPKGAVAPIGLYELLGERAIVAGDDALLKYVAAWEQAFGHYQNRLWATAQSAFEALAAQRPDDKVAAIYVERCKAFCATPPPSDWDGVQRFDSK